MIGFPFFVSFNKVLKLSVSSPHYETTRSRGRLLVQELKVEVEAVEFQELEQAETTLEVEVEAVGQGSRNMVVVLTTVQAGLRLILQMQL